jgi:hypothetical protein
VSIIVIRVTYTYLCWTWGGIAPLLSHVTRITIIDTIILTNYTNNAYYCDTCDIYIPLLDMGRHRTATFTLRSMAAADDAAADFYVFMLVVGCWWLLLL